MGIWKVQLHESIRRTWCSQKPISKTRSGPSKNTTDFNRIYIYTIYDFFNYLLQWFKIKQYIFSIHI